MRDAPLQEGTPVIPRTQGSFWIALIVLFQS